jgi:hypothetical protein
MVEIGKIKEAKEDITALFFITQQRIIDKAECRKMLNGIRKELGFTAEISEDEFMKNFTAPAQPQAPPAPKEIPASSVKHEGQHHTVEVDVPEGQEQVVDASMKKPKRF